MYRIFVVCTETLLSAVRPLTFRLSENWSSLYNDAQRGGSAFGIVVEKTKM